MTIFLGLSQKGDVMKHVENEVIRDHLEELEMRDMEKAEIMLALRDELFAIFPNATEEIKYGGIVFLMEGQLFGGIFASKKHVSFEFSHGAKMKDPEKHLEGGGKYRRHLKIHSLTEIKAKQVPFFIQQALDNRP